jgi:hypothetical protein
MRASPPAFVLHLATISSFECGMKMPTVTPAPLPWKRDNVNLAGLLFSSPYLGCVSPVQPALAAGSLPGRH